VTIVPGSIAVYDLPNHNEVVSRFAQTRLEDTYRIRIAGGPSGLRTKSGDTPAVSPSFDFLLDLGAFGVAVIPQLVTGSGGTLTQARNTIDVHFNREDPLAQAYAENPAGCRLFEIDPATGNEVGPVAPITPTAVDYAAATGKATLTFAAGAIADDRLYGLQVGAAGAFVTPAAIVGEGSDDNSSFVTARDLGVLDGVDWTIDGGISPPIALYALHANWAPS
jgi:hypothetical protein